MSYRDSDVTGLNESSLAIFYWTGLSWSALSGCVVDTSANTVTCGTNHFSSYGLFGSPISSGTPASTPASSGGGGYRPGLEPWKLFADPSRGITFDRAKAVASIPKKVTQEIKFPEIKFKDIATHWAEHYINALAEQNIVKGIDDEHFKPEDFITRAEFIAMVMRTFLADEMEEIGTFEKSIFSDIGLDDWYATMVMLAYQKGIVTGNQVTVRDLTLADRYTEEGIKVAQYILQQLGYNISVTGVFDQRTRNAISNYQYDRGFERVQGTIGMDTIRYLNEDNNLDGVTKLFFRPNDTISRAEAVKVLLLAQGITPPTEISEALFEDVDGDAWYAPYVSAAQNSDIVNGKTPAIFEPALPITRAEAAKIVYRSKIKN